VLERRSALALLLGAGAAACLGATPGSPGLGEPASASRGAPGATIVIENMQFIPATLTVRRGERVTWINKDIVPHDVTAGDKSFDSGSIAAGATWSTVAGHAGQVAYACSFHPTMTATLVVR
jgi:plastocyanin